MMFSPKCAPHMLPRSEWRSSGIPAGVRDRPYQCGQCPPLQKARFRAAQPRPSLDTTFRARSPNRASFTGRHSLCNRPSFENCPDAPDIATALHHAPLFSRRTVHESPNQELLRQPQRAHAPRQPRRVHRPAPRLPPAPVNPGLLLPWQSRSRPSSYRTRASSRTTASASLTGTQSTPHADQGSSIQGPGIRSTPVPGTAPELSFRSCRPPGSASQGSKLLLEARTFQALCHTHFRDELFEGSRAVYRRPARSKEGPACLSARPPARGERFTIAPV